MAILETVSQYNEEEEVGAITQTVARYIVQAKFNDFPPDVIEYAKLCIRDPIGCALAAASTGPGEVIINNMKNMGGQAESTIIGDGTKIPLLHAAYVNTRLASLLDWDDGYDFLAHTGATTVGSALAAAEAVGASGKDLITAVVLAYEVSTRIGAATCHSGWKPGEFPSQSFAIFSALVPVCRLLNLNEKQVVNALGLAAESCLGHGWRRGQFARKERKSWTKGQDNRSLCSLLGTLAAIQARDGFEGQLAALDTDTFWVMGGAEACDYNWITKWLGKEYNILKNHFKPTPNCRFIHASLTGVKELLAEWPLNPEQIENINVRSFSLAQGMMRGEPHKIGDVWQNLPYAIAMVVKKEKPGLNWYTKKNLEDPVALGISKKVTFEENLQATQTLAREGRWTATVEITANNGMKKSKHVPYAWGEPENPMTEDEHQEKFEACARGLLGKAKTQQVLTTLNDLDKLDKVSKLTDLLSPERRNKGRIQ